MTVSIVTRLGLLHRDVAGVKIERSVVKEIYNNIKQNKIHDVIIKFNKFSSLINENNDGPAANERGSACFYFMHVLVSKLVTNNESSR